MREEEKETKEMIERKGKDEMKRISPPIEKERKRNWVLNGRVGGGDLD